MTRSKKKKKRKRRAGPTGMRLVTISRLVVLLPCREYGKGERDEKEGIIAPFAKSFVVISNHAYYLNVNFFLENML